jgi:hypothetical protein
MGRLNFGHEINNQRKGLNGEVLIDAKVHKKWEMFPIEFKENFIEGPKTEKWKPLFINLRFYKIVVYRVRQLVSTTLNMKMQFSSKLFCQISPGFHRVKANFKIH